MKSINYNEKTKVFTLRTKNSMYQMQVVEYETLVHLYYGADIGDTESFGGIFEIPDVDASMLPTALSAWIGDFREILMRQAQTGHFLLMSFRRSIPDMETGITGSTA